MSYIKLETHKDILNQTIDQTPIKPSSKYTFKRIMSRIKYKKLPNFDDDNFPMLSSSPEKTEFKSAWSKPLDTKLLKQIKQDKQKDTYSLLRRLDRESDSQYFHRLSTIFSQTTRIGNYKIYIVKNKSTVIKIAARNQTIARYLCQLDEYTELLQQWTNDVRSKKIEIYEQIQDDDYLYSEVIDLVNNDSNKLDKAVDMFCSNTIPKPKITSTVWLNTKKTSCVESNETCISKEKILL